MTEYYDGTKLLSMLDIEGNKPEIFMVTTNRTGGKTTYYSRLIVNKFLKGQGKFAILYRFDYELDDVDDKFFKDIKGLFFPNYYMRSENRAKGKYRELFLCSTESVDDKGISCGYAIALNSADTIKKYSHLFSDVNRMFMDEFQSETNHYCSDEVKKFISIHTSIARGQGEQVRYVPVYMCSNPVSIINPYYTDMGISSRLREDTHYLKGNGFVLEQGYVDSANIAQKNSGFMKAFSNNEYTAYASEAVYLNDSKAFIEKPLGIGQYLCTIKYENNEYAIRQFNEEGIIYVDDKVDTTFKLKIAVTTKDHNVNYVMLKSNEFIIFNMRYYFEQGCVRFKDLKCKEAFLKLISY